MDKPISNSLRITFLIHCIVSAVMGAAMWLVPGRALTLLGWVSESVQLPGSELSIPGQTFVDPLISRLFGAALLALAFSSFLGWMAKRWEQVALVVQQEAIFCVLSVGAFIAVLVLGGRMMPLSGWALLALSVAFSVAWGVAWMSEGRAGPP